VKEEVTADFVSEQELTCLTPSFEAFGPRKVEVYVSINKADYTITKANYTYFLNTKAENTIAYGPGVLAENSVGYETRIII
jgi:dynein heavy chain